MEANPKQGKALKEVQFYKKEIEKNAAKKIITNIRNCNLLKAEFGETVKVSDTTMSGNDKKAGSKKIQRGKF